RAGQRFPGGRARLPPAGRGAACARPLHPGCAVPLSCRSHGSQGFLAPTPRETLAARPLVLLVAAGHLRWLWGLCLAPVCDLRRDRHPLRARLLVGDPSSLRPAGNTARRGGSVRVERDLVPRARTAATRTHEQ